MLTRLNGEQFALNPDLLERIEATPDTVLTLLDGTKYVVLEPVAAVIREVRDFRASVIAAARTWDAEPRLALAPSNPDRQDAAESENLSGSEQSTYKPTTISTLRRS